jgi:hypothetical protein
MQPLVEPRYCKGAGMKKWIMLTVAAGFLLTLGCAQEKPEVAAKQYVNEMIATKHPGFALDTSKVTYKVVQQDDATALVEVTGKIAVTASIPLVKQGTKWVLDERGRPSQAKVEAAKAPAGGKTAAGH